MAQERTLSLKQLAAEINRTYQQIIDGEKKSIEYATEIGEMLIAAKKQHGEHGRWLDWLKAECPNIAETTATLYMRIAKNGDALAAVAEANGQRVADLTIRGAAKLLAKPPTNGSPQSTQTRTRSGNAARSGGSTDLKDLLKNVGADELVVALKEADWDGDEIRKLVSILSARLQQPSGPATPRPQPSTTSSVRPS
jgi:lipopolysaccharide biosynthesis regulator YciM